jgi:hypothetical protein
MLMKIYTFYCRCLIVLCLLLLTSVKIYAQRNYATSQINGTAGICLGCAVVNPTNAADGNLQTFSTLSVTVGIGAETYQSLIFPASGGVAANTPVTIKIGSANNLLDLTLLGGFYYRHTMVTLQLASLLRQLP